MQSVMFIITPCAGVVSLDRIPFTKCVVPHCDPDWAYDCVQWLYATRWLDDEGWLDLAEEKIAIDPEVVQYLQSIL